MTSLQKHLICSTHSAVDMTEVNASFYSLISWSLFWADFNELSINQLFDDLSESLTSQHTETFYLILELKESMTQVFISELNSILTQLISLKAEISNL